MKSYEIERKYLVPAAPENLSSFPYHEIEQGYLSTEPVVRIRRQDEEYYLTYKSKGLMIREEYNLPLTKESYLHLREKIDGRLISKRRYLIPYGDYTIELDPLFLTQIRTSARRGGVFFRRRSPVFHPAILVRRRCHKLFSLPQQQSE